MNRVAIMLNEHGEFEGVVADSGIEFFVVQPSCERDRVYKFSSGKYGPQYVQEAFAGKPVGHIDDDLLAGGTSYGKEQPSRPTLALISVSPSEEKK